MVHFTSKRYDHFFKCRLTILFFGFFEVITFETSKLSIWSSNVSFHPPFCLFRWSQVTNIYVFYVLESLWFRMVAFEGFFGPFLDRILVRLPEARHIFSWHRGGLVQFDTSSRELLSSSLVDVKMMCIYIYMCLKNWHVKWIERRWSIDNVCSFALVSWSCSRFYLLRCCSESRRWRNAKMSGFQQLMATLSRENSLIDLIFPLYPARRN